MIVEINKWVWVKVSDLVDHRYIAIAHPLLGTQFLPCQMNWVVGVASVASYQKGSDMIWIKVCVATKSRGICTYCMDIICVYICC